MRFKNRASCITWMIWTLKVFLLLLVARLPETLQSTCLFFFCFSWKRLKRPEPSWAETTRPFGLSLSNASTFLLLFPLALPFLCSLEKKKRRAAGEERRETTSDSLSRTAMHTIWPPLPPLIQHTRFTEQLPEKASDDQWSTSSTWWPHDKTLLFFFSNIWIHLTVQIMNYSFMKFDTKAAETTCVSAQTKEWIHVSDRRTRWRSSLFHRRKRRRRRRTFRRGK